jgi:hypothetical protein
MRQWFRKIHRGITPNSPATVHGVVFDIFVGWLAEPKLRKQRRLETRPGFEPG